MKKLQLPFKTLVDTMTDDSLFDDEKENELRLRLRILEAERGELYGLSDAEMDLAVKEEMLRYRRNKGIFQIMRSRRGSNV
jgi:hypothetical protein